MSDQQPSQPGAPQDSGAERRPTLNLFVPPQAPPSPDSFLLDPRQTEAWFETLPKANVGETARRVYNTLVDFNRMELPPVLRAKNAEQFREPVDYICRNLRRHYTDLGFPLSEKGQKAAALARALYTELAISYKSIVRDLLDGNAERFDQKLLVISLHRAATHLRDVLLQAALVYNPWPATVWRELHTLYAYAWQNRIHPIKVREGQARDGEQSPLQAVYLSALMFAVAEPQRLRQGQQLALMRELPRWYEFATLGPADEMIRGPGHFQVDLFSDAPPRREAPETPAANRRMRHLDLQTALKHLRQLFDKAPWQGSAGSDTRGNTLGRQLLRTVIHSWGTGHERRFVRTRLNFELTVLVGLNGVHNYLMHQALHDPRDGDTADRYSSSFTRHQDVAAVDAWSEPFSHGLGRPLKVEADVLSDTGIPDLTPSSLLADSDEPPPARQGPGIVTRTLNESAGGYCIQWQGDNLPRIRVGELVGIVSSENGPDIGLACIRWMRHEVGKPMQFGVQILAPGCEAGEATPSGEFRQQYARTPQRCLTLIRPQDHGVPPSLLLPSALFAVDTLLTLKLASGKRTIRLSQVMETTGAFALYQYVDVTPGQTSGNSAGGGEFDDLWNNL